MNRNILTIFFTAISILAHGQFEKNSKWDNVTIYEYGVPLTSCESNFKNLFQNWKKWITNNEDTKLITYKYIEMLRDSILIKHYAEQLNNWESLGREIDYSHLEEGNADTTTFTRKLCFYINQLEKYPEYINNDSIKITKYKLEMESIFNIRKQYFINTVHVGDKVYSIKLKVQNKTYNHYVICRPKENKVVFDNLFLDINEIRYRLDNIIP